ncbi:MAG: sugar ABC transporter substrate-binding protein, partial [Tabrizicola sp.]|nr:sugar ABC transporter substrate-binding protein [Tabrizicola sp.]
MTKTFRLALLASTVLSGAAWAEDVTLTIESWRNDDLTIWQDTIIPAFEAANPGIKVVFAP